jgi:hypothetical protein
VVSALNLPTATRAAAPFTPPLHSCARIISFSNAEGLGSSALNTVLLETLPQEVALVFEGKCTVNGPVLVAARSKALLLVAWLLGSWVRIPLEAWNFVFVFLCYVVLCR